MTAADVYPSVTVVAGPIRYSGPATLGHMLRMHNGGAYITITTDVAKQWIGVLQTITEENK